MPNDRDKLLKIMDSLEADYRSGRISPEKYSYFRSKYEDKLNLSNLQTQVSALVLTITELENRISQLETQLTGVEAQLAQI